MSTMIVPSSSVCRWHYECIKGIKGKILRWRVANDMDCYIAAFRTEEDAQLFVRKHNESLTPPPAHWKF